MNTFKLQLGDWSHDGHGYTGDYVFKTNKSIKELREIYFQTKEIHGDVLERLYSS